MFRPIDPAASARDARTFDGVDDERGERHGEKESEPKGVAVAKPEDGAADETAEETILRRRTTIVRKNPDRIRSGNDQSAKRADEQTAQCHGKDEARSAATIAATSCRRG